MYVRLCCARFKQLPPIVLFFPYTTLFRSTRRGFTYSAHLGARRFALESDANRTARGAHSTRNQRTARDDLDTRSEEHTSELQSRGQLVCRLLLEKKKFFCISQACYMKIGV